MTSNHMQGMEYHVVFPLFQPSTSNSSSGFSSPLSSAETSFMHIWQESDTQPQAVRNNVAIRIRK